MFTDCLPLDFAKIQMNDNGNPRPKPVSLASTVPINELSNVYQD